MGNFAKNFIFVNNSDTMGVWGTKPPENVCDFVGNFAQNFRFLNNSDARGGSKKKTF